MSLSACMSCVINACVKVAGQECLEPMQNLTMEGVRRSGEDRGQEKFIEQ